MSTLGWIAVGAVTGVAAVVAGLVWAVGGLMDELDEPKWGGDL